MGPVRSRPISPAVTGGQPPRSARGSTPLDLARSRPISPAVTGGQPPRPCGYPPSGWLYALCCPPPSPGSVSPSAARGGTRHPAGFMRSAAPRLRRVRSARRPPAGVPAIRLALCALLPPAFAGFGQPVGRPAAGHVPDDLMPDLFNAGAEAGQHLSGDAAALTDEAEQD